MTQSSDTITVQIGDRSYTLRAGDNPDYVRQVAQFVDRKMKDISTMAPSLQPTHLAVLTAINIADELFQKTAVPQDTVDEVKSRLQLLIDMIPALPER